MMPAKKSVYKAQTGLMNFDDDWVGLFIRDIDASRFRDALVSVGKLANKSEDKDLRELVQLLDQVDNIETEMVSQKMLSFSKCLRPLSINSIKDWWTKLNSRKTFKLNDTAPVPPPKFSVGSRVRVYTRGSPCRILARRFDYSDNWSWQYELRTESYNPKEWYHEATFISGG
jgi:hypothetical protein